MITRLQFSHRCRSFFEAQIAGEEDLADESLQGSRGDGEIAKTKKGAALRGTVAGASRESSKWRVSREYSCMQRRESATKAGIHDALCEMSCTTKPVDAPSANSWFPNDAIVNCHRCHHP